MSANLSPIGSGRLALRSCRRFETDDPDEARERISQVMQPHRLRLRDHGNLSHAHMDFVVLAGLGLGTIAFGAASIEVPPLDDYHLLIFCLNGHGEIHTDTDQFAIDGTRGVVCAPNQPVTGHFLADCEQFVLRVDRQRFAIFTGRPDMRLSPQFDMRDARLRPWLNALGSLVTCAATLRLVQDHPDVAADYEQLLLRLLVSGCGIADGDKHRAPVRPSSFRKAIAFIEANAGASLTLADIALASGVPDRTLYHAFRQSEGVSPMRYLRNFRLDRVKSRLVAGYGPVTEVALSEGFTHLGRFAQDYAARFATASVPARAQWIVYDPTNFSQNVPTAARELQQVNQNIQSPENQATMLINQAKNLASLP